MHHQEAQSGLDLHGCALGGNPLRRAAVIMLPHVPDTGGAWPGDALMESDTVSKIGFTGSTRIGKLLTHGGAYSGDALLESDTMCKIGFTDADMLLVPHQATR